MASATLAPTKIGLTYDLTTISWPAEGIIIVHDVCGVRIATFSCEFLRKGHVTTWAFVLDTCRAIVNEYGHLHESQLDQAGSPPSAPSYATKPLDPSGSVRPSQLVYARSDDPSLGISWAVGPRFKYKARGPPPTSGDSGTMSHSSRSTVQQTSFRMELLGRDGTCIVTDDDEAQAAHILPQSRPEYYIEALGHDPVNYFNVSFGLLLQPVLHRRWDSGSWALYPDPLEPTTLIVHVFEGVGLEQYHGKRILRSRFRGQRRVPNRQLLEFHYRQCVLKHIRGFAVFPEWSS